jgi:tubulin polyglutamylase TTLL4
VERLSPEDWNILFEFDEEFHRRGDFERIFPNKDTVDHYSKFFLSQRYNNLLVQKWLTSKENFLQKICKKVSN